MSSKRKKEFKEENKNNFIVITIIGLILVGTVMLVLDYFLQWENTNLEALVEILFSAFASLAGIWISCFLLFLQLYKDRYPLEKMKAKYFPAIKYSFLLVIYTILYGCIVLCLRMGILSNIWFCCITVFSILDMILRIYKSNKSLMINSYVKDICKEIRSELEASNNSISQGVISNFKSLLEECVIKEEYYIVQKIVEETGGIFRSFLENSIKISQKGSSKNMEDGFDQIISLNIYQLKLCKNIKSETLIAKIVNQQTCNLLFCVENCQIEWYKRYLSQYNLFFYKTQNEANKIETRQIYRGYTRILGRLSEEKKDYLIYTLDEIEKLAIALFYDDVGISRKEYINFLTGGILFSCEEKKEYLYEILIKKVNDFSNSLCRHSSAFKEIKVYYDVLFSKLKEENFDKAYRFFENIFKIDNNGVDNPDLIEFKFYCLYELNRSENIDKLREKILEYHIQVLEEVIELKDKYFGFIFLPEFEKMIFDNEYNIQKVEEVINKIEILMNRSLVQDNISMFYLLQKKVNAIIRKTVSRQKDIQIKLLNISFWLFIKTRNLVNKQFFEIVYNSFEENVRDLDKKRGSVSNDLIEYILKELVNCAQTNIRGDTRNLIAIIEMLFGFLEVEKALTCISCNPKLKKQLCRGLFNIGTECIENNCEEGLRAVSNSLGWLTIYSIKQTTNDLTLYLIERAEELYKISKKMEISSKTQMFILTLFTTVGTYCCGDNKLNKYKSAIIRSIIDEDLSKIEIAIGLRTSENDMWNNLYCNHTVEWTRSFLRNFTEEKKRNLVKLVS